MTAGVTKVVIHNDGDLENANNSYGQWSDIKIKENIQDVGDHYLEDLMKVRVVKYSLKEQKSEGPTHIGMIAQEFEKIFPKLVKELEDEDNEGETIKSIKMSVLVPILVKAVQTLTKRVEELERSTIVDCKTLKGRNS